MVYNLLEYTMVCIYGLLESILGKYILYGRVWVMVEFYESVCCRFSELRPE